ncbi:MAG TPA: glycosyltransferase [Rariglobus sp.]
MKKVLIISPHFAPTNAPDMQRARLAIPYLRAHGWEPVVLAIAPEYIEGGVLDPLLEATYPADTRIVRVRGIPPRLTRWLGIGSLWLRCGRAFRAAGEKLLREEKFDLVFFTTTQFDAFTLGPLWKRQFGLPYVLDYQDPWVNDYYGRTRTKPPGGMLKFACAQWRARRQEPGTLREASGVIAVSDAYSRTLAGRYPWFPANRVLLLPFGAAAADIATARGHTPARPLVDFNDGCFHHIYAGRCGPDMSISLTAIFRAFKRFRERQPEKASRIRFHFIGTDYAPPPLGREWAMPIARGEGVGEYVTEHCYRVPYFDALHYLVKADALLAVGSNDPTYSASKIFPYILAERPMLVVFNRHSPVLAFAKQADCGERFSFDSADEIDDIAEQIARVWFEGGRMREVHATNAAAFLPFTAESMTARLVDCFNAALHVPPQ